MIRPLTIVSFLMACGSGLYLYESKHESQVLDRMIEQTVRETGALREQSRLLSTEWTMLNDPEQLRHFSDTYLALKTITPVQFSSLADLDSRLPAAEQPETTPSQKTDEDAADPAVVVPASGASVVAPARGAAGLVAPATGTAVLAPALGAGGLAEPAAGAAETSIPGARRSAAMPHMPTPVLAVSHPMERKVATVRPGTADTGSSLKGTPGMDVRLPEPRSPAARTAELHGRDVRANEVRLKELHADPRAMHVVEARATDIRVPIAAPAPRPVLAAAPRLVGSAPSPLPIVPYTGSLLGMARGPASAPVPRPTPVNATQWYSAN